MGALVDVAGSVAVREAERLTPREDDPDGWQLLRLHMEWPREAPARLVALGPDAEVLEPVELRAQVAAIAAQVAQRYSTRR